MHAGEVIAADMSGRRETIVTVHNQPSGLAFQRDGSLLISSMLDSKVLRLSSAGLTEVADLGSFYPYAINDMVGDRAGRAYVGGLPDMVRFQSSRVLEPTPLVLVDPQGEPGDPRARAVAQGLFGPNGAVLTPDGRTLIVAESGALRLTSFNVQPDGALTKRQVWADLGVVPDGICLDEEGCVWVAVPYETLANLPSEASCYLRVAKGGEIRQRIGAHGRRAFAVALGGHIGRTLFLLESTSALAQETSRGSGAIRIVDVEVPAAKSSSEPADEPAICKGDR